MCLGFFCGLSGQESAAFWGGNITILSYYLFSNIHTYISPTTPRPKKYLEGHGFKSESDDSVEEVQGNIAI
jgi:hypothetical protein